MNQPLPFAVSFAGQFGDCYELGQNGGTALDRPKENLLAFFAAPSFNACFPIVGCGNFPR
jgi:hypothetical protein